MLEYRTSELLYALQYCFCFGYYLGCKHKKSICNTVLLICSITTNNCYCGCLPTMSKKPRTNNESTHAQSMRLKAHSHDQTKQDMGQFSKRKRKEVFDQSTLNNRIIWGPFVKKKGKRGLNTTDHVLYMYCKYIFKE